MTQYFPKPFNSHFGDSIKGKIDLSNMQQKQTLKIFHIYTEKIFQKYTDTSEFNKLAADVFNVRLAQANLIAKLDFDAKLSSFNKKVTQNKTTFTC